MKTLKEGHEKIQEICDQLRIETLEPAKQEAEKIISDARLRAHEIIEDAEKQAQKHFEAARKSIDQERNVFRTSLEQASVQSLETLRQEIEKNLFNEELSRIILQETTKPDVIASLIGAVVHAIEKDGIATDISAVIPKAVPAESVNRLILDGIVKKLKEGGVIVGDFAGGAKVQLHDKKMTIDISNDALRELLTNYVRKDFRKLIFAATS